MVHNLINDLQLVIHNIVHLVHFLPHHKCMKYMIPRLRRNMSVLVLLMWVKCEIYPADKLAFITCNLERCKILAT